MPEDDRRIRRTRRALAAALIALASRRPYESITIRDITNQADVGYATFFRHYDSKDALMLDVFQGIAHDLESMAAERIAGGEGDYFEQEGLLIFAHVRENRALYCSILDSLVFTRKLTRLFNAHIGGRVAPHARRLVSPAVPPEIAVNQMAAALVSLIEWWLEHDLQPSVERMAQIYDRLVIRATWGALTGEHLADGPLDAHGRG